MHGADPLTFVSLAAAFAIGIVGGFGHCTLMCGGFVVAMNRVRGGGALDQFVYHAGRITTYAVLTLLLASFGAILQATGVQQARAIWLLALGGALLVAGWRILRPRAVGGHGMLGRWATRLGAAFRRRLQGGLAALFAAGLVWGLVPCMFSGAAVVGAASQPFPRDLAAIGAFGAGTSVALVALAVVQQRTAVRFARPARVVAASALMIWGSAMVVRAGMLLR